jgi:hypothetical protein
MRTSLPASQGDTSDMPYTVGPERFAGGYANTSPGNRRQRPAIDVAPGHRRVPVSVGRHRRQRCPCTGCQPLHLQHDLGKVDPVLTDLGEAPQALQPGEHALAAPTRDRQLPGQVGDDTGAMRGKVVDDPGSAVQLRCRVGCTPAWWSPSGLHLRTLRGLCEAGGIRRIHRNCLCRRSDGGTRRPVR